MRTDLVDWFGRRGLSERGRLRDRGHRLGELRRRRIDLLTAEPPVVLVRVILPVIEAPTRRGFPLSHVFMLAPWGPAVANQALSMLSCASKC